METILTVMIVALALAYVVWRLSSGARGKGGCSCGCEKTRACAGKECFDGMPGERKKS